MSARNDRHLLRMAANDHTSSSRQLAALWSTATDILMSASSKSAAPWIACKGASIQDPPLDKPSTAASAIGSVRYQRQSGLKPGVMVWGAISYHGRYNLLRIEGNLNSNRYVREVLHSPKSFLPFKTSLEPSFSKKMHAHVLQR
ncbi:hypothetical protein TNCV_2056131 [Trichonephila clavipes]|nr:hypothetical protein TNCV_2056131 [Trichonephila clavipes]